MYSLLTLFQEEGKWPIDENDTGRMNLYLTSRTMLSSVVSASPATVVVYNSIKYSDLLMNLGLVNVFTTHFILGGGNSQLMKIFPA